VSSTSSQVHFSNDFILKYLFNVKINFTQK
jgi:hypothetical protein